MGGDANRQGLIFQDRYLLWRLLRETGEAMDRRFAEPALSPAAVATRFGVEARPAWLHLPGVSGPAWDVVAESPQELEIIEVKSGEINAPDRRALWRRLRWEMSLAAPDARLVPTLVVDPQRALDSVRWEEMATLAARGSTRLPRAAPRSVRRPDRLLEEALWHLCVNRSHPAPRVPRAVALAVLARLRVARHPAPELATAVARGIELLFADGLTQQIENTIHGWLDQRATSPNPGERFLTVKDLLREMRLFDATARLAPGSLECWRGLWHDLPPLFNERANVHLGRDHRTLDVPHTQPVAMSRLAHNSRFLLKGEAGTGKTGLLRQLAERENAAGTEVFCVAADTVIGSSQLQELFKSLRFKRAIGSVRDPERGFWLGVDGLDEVNDEDLRRKWAQNLAQFATGERTTVAASVRQDAWQEHGALRPHLDGFTVLPVEDWPEELVRDVLASVPGVVQVSPSLLGLLRRVLFLDLFLRTFAGPEATAAPTIGSRHDLLTEFWDRRVLGSRRPRPAVGFPARLGDVLRAAADTVGGFDTSSLDQTTVALLVSEGVLVAEGGHAFRHRFRHPLLRDHAFAFWCLGAGGAHGVVERWQTIQGHLQAQGALRAILETLRRPDAESRYPSLELGALIGALATQPSLARPLARLLGTFAPLPAMDPAAWSASIRAALPAGFGRELVVAARSAENGEWARLIRQWPPDANWLDEEFLEAFSGYTGALFQLSNRHWYTGGSERGPAELAALEHARLAASKLRALLGHGRFAAVAARNYRFLQASALELVIKLLPGSETFVAVENELPHATYRTRISILDGLLSLAASDPARATAVFRQTVGLENTSGTPTLDLARWQPGVLANPAIKGVLGGQVGNPSVLARYPREFMPMALEFAEALSATDYPRRAGSALWDNLFHWHNFWNRDHRHRPMDLCLWSIRRACNQIADADPALFLHEIVPRLHQSPSAAVQSICLDVLLLHPGSAEYKAALGACLLDARLYHVPLLLYWLENALRLCWSAFDAAQRAQVLALIDGIAANSAPGSSASYRRAQLLATVPAHDLTDPRLQSLAAANATGYSPTPHPREPPIIHLSGLDPEDGNDPDTFRVANWPPEFGADALLTLSRGGRLLSERGVNADTVREHLPLMIAAAAALLEPLENHSDTLQQHQHLWMWEALRICTNATCPRRFATAAPPPALINTLARLALATLEAGPPGPENGQTLLAAFSVLETPWGKALQLADAALCWPSTQADDTLQRRFVHVWRDAFAAHSPAVQAAVTQAVGDEHWFKNDARRQLDDALVWMPPRPAVVLAASIGRLSRMDGERQTRLARRLLERPPIGPGVELAERLGLWLGQEAMDLLPSGARPVVVSLVDGIADDMHRWALLAAPGMRRAFFYQCILGMERVAGQLWRQAERLAEDYGRWNLAFWRALREAGPENEQREAAAIPLFWMPRHYPGAPSDPALTQRDPALMKIWWTHLQPFCRRVAEEGAEEDARCLFQNLRPGQMDHVLQAREVFGWVEILLDRLQAGIAGGDQAGWEEVLRYAVNALDSLRADGLLRTDQHWDGALRLLDRMASPPFDLDLAMHLLERFPQELM